MKTITLKVYETAALEVEITHLLKLKAPIKLKYSLTQLLLKTQAELAPARQLLTALFEAHGQPGGEDGRTFMLPQFKEGTMEKTAAFVEYETINSQEVELNYTPINLALFDNIDSDENYPVLFRLVELAE